MAKKTIIAGLDENSLVNILSFYLDIKSHFYVLHQLISLVWCVSRNEIRVLKKNTDDGVDRIWKSTRLVAGKWVKIERLSDRQISRDVASAADRWQRSDITLHRLQRGLPVSASISPTIHKTAPLFPWDRLGSAAHFLAFPTCNVLKVSYDIVLHKQDPLDLPCAISLHYGGYVSVPLAPCVFNDVCRTRPRQPISTLEYFMSAPAFTVTLRFWEVDVA